LQENFCIKILFCNYYIIPLNILMRKGKDLDPYLRLTNPDADPGGKNRIHRMRIQNTDVADPHDFDTNANPDPDPMQTNIKKAHITGL
jgi:hypothetical protein